VVKRHTISKQAGNGNEAAKLSASLTSQDQGWLHRLFAVRRGWLTFEK
jgi:hypothetical protein